MASQTILIGAGPWRVYESPIPKMVDLGGGLLHSGLKSSFVTFITTNMVPIEPVNECYSIPAFYYAEKISLISKHFISKCQVSVAIFVGINMAAGVFTTGHFELKYFEINEIFSV